MKKLLLCVSLLAMLPACDGWWHRRCGDDCDTEVRSCRRCDDNSCSRCVRRVHADCSDGSCRVSDCEDGSCRGARNVVTKTTRSHRHDY